MNIRYWLLLLVYCFVPAVCFGIDLDTKIVWEAAAFNMAVSNYCLPILDDNERLAWFTEETGGEFLSRNNDLGIFSAFVTNKTTTEITERNVELVPKCAAFVDAYVAQYQKNNKISLNQIISMCLDTLGDNLVCENIVLNLVDISENKDNLKNFNVAEMEQKIKASISADHTICSQDNKFCTTYTLFNNDRPNDFSIEGLSVDNADAIYEKNTGKIIGICAGVKNNSAKALRYMQRDSRCTITDPAYEYYEFTIQDLGDASIYLVYTDWAKTVNKLKNNIAETNKLISELDSCLSKKVHETEVYDDVRALATTHMGLALELCEKDNDNDADIALCKLRAFKQNIQTLKKSINQVSAPSNNKFSNFEQQLYDIYLGALVIFHQVDLLLSECEVK